jgi:predicted methyltransferase MtxX (methanogen marker protein 4)
MLEAMALITSSQPSDTMTRIASRRNRTISLDPNLPGQNSRERFFNVDSKLFSKVQIDSKEDWARIRSKIRVITSQSITIKNHNFTFSLAAVSVGSLPVVRRLLK